MDHLAHDFNAPRDVKARLADQLLRYYSSELASLQQPPAPQFSLTRTLLAQAGMQTLPEHEQGVLHSAALLMNQHLDLQRCWVPLSAIRGMSTMPGSSGGYLKSADVLDPFDVLRPWSVVASAGAMLMGGLQGDAVIPRVVTKTTAATAGEVDANPSENSPSLGNVSLTPKEFKAFIRFSIQTLRQGQAAEPFIRQQLLAAIGELLDQKYFAGQGGVDPLGLLQTPGIGTQAGAALAHSGILAMRRQVLAAGGQEKALTWVGAPAVQETLGARERSTGGGRFLWDGASILGLPAYATSTAPTGALVVGDFSKSVVGMWGSGIRIDVDPSQGFNTGELVARILLMADVAFPQPSAFSVATSVS